MSLLRKQSYVLRERERAPAELPGPCAMNADEFDLHVLKSYQHCIYERGSVE